MSARKREELHPAERRERSEACRGWVERYGRDFRTVQGCGKDLVRLKGARQGEFDIQACAVYLDSIVKRNATEGVARVASCVRHGYSHGVTQAGWRPKKKPRR